MSKLSTFNRCAGNVCGVVAVAFGGTAILIIAAHISGPSPTDLKVVWNLSNWAFGSGVGAFLLGLPERDNESLLNSLPPARTREP